MKTAKHVSTSHNMMPEVQLARFQLAKAEQQRKSVKEQLRLAKRRRKEAKEAVRRARKQAKLAKRAVAEAKQALAEAEKRLVRPNRRAAKTKSSKPSSATARVSARRKKTPRRIVEALVSPGAVPATKPVKRDHPELASSKAVSGVNPAVEGEAVSITVPREFELPASSASPTTGQTALDPTNPNPAEQL